MLKRKRKLMIFSILFILIGISIGFSAFQKQLLIDDSIFTVRLQEEVRVSNLMVSKTNGDAISNYEDYNKAKLYGNVTLPSASSYVLYKVDLSNYGNVKSGLLKIENHSSSGVNYSICDSNGGNCSNSAETAICNGNNCTLGSTKEIYVKVSSSSTGTKNIDLDFDFEPYNDITYEYIRENTSGFKTEIMSNAEYELTLTSKPEEVEVSGTASYTYNNNTGVLTISNVGSDIVVSGRYKVNVIGEVSNFVRFNDNLYRIIKSENIEDGFGNTDYRTKIVSFKAN